MTIWTPQAHAPPLICMEQILVPILFHFCSTSGTLLPMWLKKKEDRKCQKVFEKASRAGLDHVAAPTNSTVVTCNYSLFKTLPSTTLSFLVRHLLHLNLNLSLSLSRSLSLMAIATESPQQEKVIQLGKKMPLSCVIRVLICIRWVGFLCFSDLNSLYPFAWFVKINGFSLFL